MDAQMVRSDVDCGGQVAVVLDIAVGRQHSCFLLASGQVKCVGGNDFGQLGIGSRQWPEHNLGHGRCPQTCRHRPKL